MFDSSGLVGASVCARSNGSRIVVRQRAAWAGQVRPQERGAEEELLVEVVPMDLGEALAVHRRDRIRERSRRIGVGQL